MFGLRVEAYSIETLREIIASSPSSLITSKAVASKAHIEYFETYFGSYENRAATIVVEEPYTDRDFLEDYAAYYVRCLDKYTSRCCRLHFFSIAFTQADLDALIKGDSSFLTEEEFVKPENYLGFIVIRPLPQTFVGRTCLRVYPDDGDRRHYPVTRNYAVHLAGFTLEVRSLAFQEQDRATSACATSALWSAFHGTGVLFHHSIYSPVEITRHAVERIPGTGRSFPNNGLTIWQMASAITGIGLEPETLDVSKEAILQGVSYGYLKAGIPVLMIAALYDAADPNDVKCYDENDPKGAHAVAITGFSLGGTSPIPYGKHNVLLHHTRIDKLYVHDDQIGPFSRAEFDGRLNREGCSPVSAFSLRTSWRTKAGQAGAVRFAPESAIVPLYHKIRIPYLSVLAEVIALDHGRFEPLRRRDPEILPSRLEWDIYLTTGWAMKADIRKNTAVLSPDARHDLIQEQYPRFIWRATARCGEIPIVDVLYDATDIETGSFVLGPIWYDEKVAAAIYV